MQFDNTDLWLKSTSRTTKQKYQAYFFYWIGKRLLRGSLHIFIEIPVNEPNAVGLFFQVSDEL